LYTVRPGTINDTDQPNMHPKPEYPISQEVLNNSAFILGMQKKGVFRYKRNPATPK
jgi:hypothetical protein